MLDGMNFFGAVQAMMNRLMSQILTAFQTIIPVGTMINLIWLFIAGFFVWHVLETIYQAGTKGSVLGFFAACWDLVRRRIVRMIVYVVLAFAGLYVVNGGGAGVQAMGISRAARNWGNVPTLGGSSDLASDTGEVMSKWLGSNATHEDPGGNGTKILSFNSEAPVISTLKAASERVVDGINALNYEMVYGQIEKEVETLVQPNATHILTRTAQALGSFGSTELLRAFVDAIFYLMNWWTFVWAQWTLTRTLLLQTLFLQMSWHLGLYFLPVFILMAYFRSLQGFLTNLLKNYFAMMMAGYVMAAVALVLFDPMTWVGNPVGGGNGHYSGGIIQLAFKGVKLGAAGSFQPDPGTFMWFTRNYMKQVAFGQVVWMWGACGLILGQVYDLVRGVLDGGFRSHFQGGSAGSGTVFGGK